MWVRAFPLPLLGGLLVLALAAACGSRPPMVPAGETGVGRLRFVGVDSVDEDALLDGLGLVHARELGQPFARFLVALDRRRIRSYYVRRGYFAVTVETAVERVDNRADVTFTVVEGARARLASIVLLELPDDPRIDPAALRARIPMRDGQPFDYETWELAKPRLTDALQQLGYAWAQIDGVVLADPERAEAVIRVTVDAGPRAVFGKVALTGVPPGLEDAVNARIQIEPGAPFDPRAIEKTRAQLYEMGRFSLVRVEPDRTVRGKEVVNVAINVGEAPRHELRLGGGIGIDPATYEVHGRAGYSVAGWPTPLVNSRVELRPAYTLLRAGWDQQPRLEALSAMERLDLFRPRLRGEVEASFAYLTVEAYTSVGPRLRLGLRTPIYRDTINVSAGWQLRRLEFRRLNAAIDAATATELGLDDPYLLGFYEQSVSVDLRDDPVAPRSGAYGEIGVEEGTVAAGGEFDYMRLTPDLRGYVPLGPLVFAARSRLGVILGDLPVTQRFFAGGASSQRGFPVRRLAPTVTSTVDGEPVSVVIGGGASLEVGGELRAHLGTIKGLALGGVLFLDGADVTERIGGLDLTNLHWAAGAGLRIATLIGPVRIDVGYRLNRTGVGEPQAGEHLAYHLSLGEAF